MANIEFTPSDDFSLLEDGDTSAEVVGYVDQVEAPRQVGLRIQYNLLKFVLNNNDGRNPVFSLGSLNTNL